jgi:molybdopterin-guanine dinucleotide biosynthesis protein
MILMYYWTPKRIKELKEKGYKLRLVKHDPGDEQADKQASEQASKRASKRTSSDQASEEDSSNKR